MNHDTTPLIHAYLDGELAEGDQFVLASWLRESQENVDRFTAECRLHSELCAACGDRAFPLPGNEIASTFGPSVHVAPLPCPAPPIILDSSASPQSPLFTLHSPLGSYVFSHIAAAVILGIGLLIGLAWRISLPSPERPNESATGSASAVGRITALADCKGRQWSVASGQWSEITNHKLEIINHKFFLGDRFVLSTGLMEIAYDTGAKVILQGPCTYEIDSDRGGYLAVGKLTARIVASGQWPVASKVKQQKPEAESLTTDHRPLATALFAVRTPTATVTDLGTEFGVDVEKSGATRSHVFQGSVELVPSPNGREVRGEGSIVLGVGQSACVERGRNRVVVITREPGRPDRFVRHIPSSFIPHPSSLGHHPSSHAPRPASPTRMSPEAYAEYVLSLAPVAYYRMKRPKAEEDRLVVHDSAPGKHHGVFWSRDRSAMPYVPGRFGDAMAFRGSQMGDCVMVRGIPKPKNNQLTVVVWTMPANIPSDHFTIFTRWGFSNRKRMEGNSPTLVHYGGDNSDHTMAANCWTHVAYIISQESGKTTSRTYTNGKLMHRALLATDLFNLPEIFWDIGGVDPNINFANEDASSMYWYGWIDELAVFNKALSPETIERLYRGGMPAAKGGHP